MVDPTVDLRHSGLVVVLDAGETLQMIFELLNVVGSFICVDVSEVVVKSQPEVGADSSRFARVRISAISASILVTVELLVVENVADLGNVFEGVIE